MASGDNVDAIEVVETSFTGPGQPAEDSRRAENSAEDDNKSTGEKVTALDNSITQHGTVGLKTPAGVSRNKSERERKIGHRRVGVGGEITYKKIQTTQIMGSIQLGIQHAVGGLASKPERDLLMQDFMTVETTNFPSEGSNHTPAHHFSEFKFKNYAPIAFRYFRDLFGIQPDDFLMSMCSAPLRELSNPGASGSIFYLTEDDEFIIKTVQHKEGEFLQTLLPGYYMNLNQNPRTLLPKFFGLYCYRCNSKNVRLVAMNNLLPSAVKLHQKYDLKGSTYKRKASKLERSKSSPTYKDLDFMEHHPEGIFLEADTYNALVKTIQRDCRVLESFKIMDYSLLVGIHNLDQGAREKAQEQRISASADDEVGEVAGESGAFIQAEREQRERDDRIGATALNRSRSINRQRLVAHSTAMESIQAESEPIDEEDDVPSPGGIPARNARGERLLLFLGIIDILQSYRLKKKLEHTWKSMIHDGDTVSVHRPGFYAQRFQDFMAKTVFKKIPSLDLPEIKGNHRKFRNLVTSYIALKHSPSKRKSITRPLRPLEGDFDSTAVAATGTSTMHATSPTKPGSPTGIVPSTTSTAISSGSVPIATSTPVNHATGPVSPPPLALSIAQAVPHQEQNAVGSGKLTTASYPAVLKGRSAASPPNPNLVPSGKVPPPVPPRGSGSRSARSPGPTTTSSSSITSSRGDEAALNTSRQYRLHESSTLLHHRPLPYSTTSTSSTTATATTTTTTIDTPTTIFPTTITTATTTTSTDYNNVIMSAANYDALHARASTPAFLPPCHENLPLIDEVVNERGIIVEKAYEEQVENDAIEEEEEEEEFVSIEQVDDSYIIRTSPYPFRPERGNYRSIDRRTKALASSMSNVTRETPELKERKPVDHMAKFTYFINPASREDLMNYKMSRKDKKHSETYYERMKRKQKEIEASISTITSISRRERSTSAVQPDERSSTRPAPVASKTSERNPPKAVDSKKENRLLRKIKERSLRKKKRLAPVPSSKKATERDIYETGQKKIMKEIERVSLRKDSSTSTYVDGRASCDNVSSDIQSFEVSYTRKHTEETLRTRYHEKVDEETSRIEKERRRHETTTSPMASSSSKESKVMNSVAGFAMRESHLMVVRSGHEEMTILHDRGLILSGEPTERKSSNKSNVSKPNHSFLHDYKKVHPFE